MKQTSVKKTRSAWKNIVTLAGDHDVKDSQKEILQVSKVAIDDDLNAKADEPEDVQVILKKVVAGVNAQMLTATLTDWFTTLLIAKLVENTLMCQLILIYIRQIVALSPLLAMFNMFLEIDKEFTEKVAQKVKMRRNDVGGHNHTEETVIEYMVNNSVNNYKAYKQGVLGSLCLVEDNLMPILCAVNTDYT